MKFKSVLASLFLILEVVIFHSSFCQADDTSTPAPDWFECATADDCVLASDPCGWPMSVNRPRSADYKNFVERTAPLIECQTSPTICLGEEAEAFTRSLKPECADKKCRVSAQLSTKLNPDCPSSLPQKSH